MGWTRFVNKEVVISALGSRVLLITLQIFSRILFPLHQPDVFDPRQFANLTYLPTTHSALAGLSTWDGKYFLHIAQHGYTYQNSLVFYPLFPLLVRLGGRLLHATLPELPYADALLITAVTINLTSFITAALCLYWLTRRKFHATTPRIASLVTAHYFCINPASPFFSAAYSESTFAALTFAAMLLLETDRLLSASLLFGLSAITRSNGAISCAIFLTYAVITRLYRLYHTSAHWSDWFAMCVKTAAMFILSVVPFLVWQLCAYAMYCTSAWANVGFWRDTPDWVLAYGDKQGYVSAPGIAKQPEHPPWCYYMVPFSYSYIQGMHWEVGFLRYYELNNIPHFMLATPIVIISVMAVRATYLRGTPMPVGDCGKKSDDSGGRVFVRGEFLPYMVHLAFLVVFGVLNIHVQVVTRIVLSSTPLVYWFMAGVGGQSNMRACNILHLYCCGYFAMGTVLHCGYYPWT